MKKLKVTDASNITLDILCWNFSEKTNSKLLFSRLQKPFLYVA